MMGYDLFDVPQGYRTDLVLLVAPYYDAKFINTLAKKLKPQTIYLVIDDGIRREEIKRLEDAGHPSKVRVALAAASGLVHIKCYYVEFVKIEGRRRRSRRLFYGSANATDAAFHGRRNAELIASVSVSAGEDSDLLAYLAGIIDGVESGSGTISGGAFKPLSSSPVLHLPSFRLAAPDQQPGFDAWLQRGVLAAKYRDPQSFLKVSVGLQKKLPQEAVATVFSSLGLIPDGDQNVVRFSYIGDAEANPELKAVPVSQWHSRYCTWTHFGGWLSDDCHRTHGAGMALQNSSRRQWKIDELRNKGTDEPWVEERKEIFLDILTRTWKALLEQDVVPNDYLRSSPLGLDVDYYGSRFTRKVQSDVRLAQDRDFQARYIKGYEFPAVPRFRQDTAAWDGFVRSWCESVALEVGKKSSRSLLASRVIAIPESNSTFELDTGFIVDWFRRSWDHKVLIRKETRVFGQYLMEYHCI